MNQTSHLITAKNISVRRDNRDILKNINIDIEPRDFITVIGPNGAGKSVLLKSLIGFFDFDEGTITRQKKLKIGYVPQRLTADQTMPLKVKDFLKLLKKPSRDHLSEIVAQTTIQKLLQLQLSTLSGGELQRVLLARALLNMPELLILDEPAQNLDIMGQVEFYKLLDKIYKERDIAILMVSHDLHMVMSSTKKVVCLKGEICCSGSPQNIAKDPAFQSIFGESIAEMMSVYHHNHHM
ncbi:MAG: ATP-binding cassette domain-containing protein [Pseudomonadota bacterium]